MRFRARVTPGGLGSSALKAIDGDCRQDSQSSCFSRGSPAMKREDAMLLLSESGDVQIRLDHLRAGLRSLLEDDSRP
jgi:hypothetical protein